MATSAESAVEKQLLKAAEVLEAHLDSELDRFCNIDDAELEAIRQKRLAQLKSQATQLENWKSSGHGSYFELKDEKEFFDATKKSERVVCHFYNDATFRCKVIDKHMTLLSPKHMETLFVKINAEKAPFLTKRLNIKVQPTLALIISSKTVDYVRGFDSLGGKDDFETSVLESRLLEAGVLFSKAGAPPAKQTVAEKNRVNQKSVRDTARPCDEDDVDDW